MTWTRIQAQKVTIRPQQVSIQAHYTPIQSQSLVE